MVDYCNLENETNEGQRGARSKRSPVHSVPDDEVSWKAELEDTSTARMGAWIDN